MLIKAAVDQNCSKCGRFEKNVEPEQYGCDQCRKPIVPYGNDERLDVTVFPPNNQDHRGIEHFYFCSWKCVFQFVKKIKNTRFFTLPYVCFDNRIKGRRGVDFLSVVKGLR